MTTYAEFWARGPAWSYTGGTPPTTLTSRFPNYGDNYLALMVTVQNGDAALSVPSGWTAITGSPWTVFGAAVPPGIWENMQVMACWKILSGTQAGPSDGPSFSLTSYDADNIVPAGGRIYVFRFIQNDIEAPFPQALPILASSFVSVAGSQVRPPQQTDPGRVYSTLTYPTLDSMNPYDNSWMVFSFVHGSHPLDYRNYDAQIKPDPPPTWVRIDPAVTGPDAGDPAGVQTGPNDSVDHRFTDGAYFFAYNAGDDLINTYDVLTPSPSQWDLIGRDFLNPPSDFYNVLPAVGGIVMVVLGGPEIAQDYWGILHDAQGF